MIERRMIKPDENGHISEADLQWIGADAVTYECDTCNRKDIPLFAFWDGDGERLCADCLIIDWLDNSEGLDELA